MSQLAFHAEKIMTQSLPEFNSTIPKVIDKKNSCRHWKSTYQNSHVWRTHLDLISLGKGINLFLSFLSETHFHNSLRLLLPTVNSSLAGTRATWSAIHYAFVAGTQRAHESGEATAAFISHRTKYIRSDVDGM